MEKSKPENIPNIGDQSRSVSTGSLTMEMMKKAYRDSVESQRLNNCPKTVTGKHRWGRRFMEVGSGIPDIGYTICSWCNLVDDREENEKD